MSNVQCIINTFMSILPTLDHEVLGLDLLGVSNFVIYMNSEHSITEYTMNISHTEYVGNNHMAEI